MLMTYLWVKIDPNNISTRRNVFRGCTRVNLTILRYLLLVQYLLSSLAIVRTLRFHCEIASSSSVYLRFSSLDGPDPLWTMWLEFSRCLTTSQNSNHNPLHLGKGVPSSVNSGDFPADERGGGGKCDVVFEAQSRR